MLVFVHATSLSRAEARERLPTHLGGKRMVKQYVMLPHDIVASMYDYHDGQQFFQTFVGVPGDTQCNIYFFPFFPLVKVYLAFATNIFASKDLETYWRDNPDLAATCPDLDLAKACPYRIYGDGADSHRNQNFEAMTMLPLMCGSHSTMDSRLLLSVRNAGATASGARVLINEVIAWSLMALRIWSHLFTNQKYFI